ncbi:hypothetical protein DY023_07810 [Microbacterium bovistercoris]|uniref:Glycogen debranching enzyme C-terminal domain-containing protein n=1 Tax=Microbacterium bovistercoris TaxID=2293570 RepID=A0A371NVM6_9MICO|nr:hypothetical protein [Microbacterium bovistercoris]REJ05850.1 hypothetical protein DY023_07810 [Microbacterium bovistercoris]
MTALTLHSDSRELERIFAWAVAEARSHVVPGGRLERRDVSERSPRGSWPVLYRDAYWAGYRHRSGFYLRDFAHQAVGAHMLGWAQRNASMLAAFVRSADERHGGWPWWAINFDLRTPLAIDYRSADRFVRELPAAFELAETVQVLHRWTGDPALREHADAARRLVEDFADAHDVAPRNGVAEASGPGIFDGTASYNELPGVVLHEAGDGFAAQYAATLHAAALLAGTDAAPRLAARAARMLQHYASVWSRGPSGEVVCGWTTAGEPVTEWSRESTWFPLLKGLLVGDRAAGELDRVDALCRDAASAPRNVEALTYLPDLFFRHGRPDTAWRWMQHIHALRDEPHEVPEQGANGSYPEVSFTLLSQIALGMLGIEPDAAGGRLTVRPGLPADIGTVELRGLPFGRGAVSVRVTKSEVHVWNGTGKALRVAACEASGFRDPHLAEEADEGVVVVAGDGAVLRRGRR